MKIELKIPPVGESISEATVSVILKPSGSAVKIDEEVLELETDKVNQVVYAPQAGILTLNVKVGDVVKIGQVIGFVDSDGKAVEAKPVPQAEKPPQEVPKQTPQIAPKSPVEGQNAREMIPEFLAGLKEPPAQKEQLKIAPKETLLQKAPNRKRMSNLRRVIAQRLVEVKNTTAMLTTFNEIDLSAVIEIRNREKEVFQKKYGVKLGFMSFFVKGVVAALKAIPQVNAQIDGEDIIQFDTYDIGVAVSTEKGLMVPVLRKCDELTFAEIEGGLENYAKKAREGAIAVDDLRGGSFTITNGGVFGSLLSTPILNPPQSAILGMHNIVKRPIAVDDQVVIRPMMYVALSYDHRIIDGKEAVLFLVHLKQTLENPDRLLLDS